MASEQKRIIRVPEQVEENVTECIRKLEGDISEGRERLSIAFDLSVTVHAQCVNVMLERERVGVDGEREMLMSGVVETERLSISISDMITPPLERVMKVEDKEIREEEEEEGVNEREDRVRVPDMALLTKTGSEERKREKVEMDTSDDPERVNAVEVRETIRPVLDRPEMERGVDGVNDAVTSSLSYPPSNRMIELSIEFPSFFKSNTSLIDEHGRSSHPQDSVETPITFSPTTPPTYIVDSESLALFIRW